MKRTLLLTVAGLVVVGAASAIGRNAAARHIEWHSGREVPPTWNCLFCHGGPEKPVDEAPIETGDHPKPAALALSKSGDELYVACEGNATLLALRSDDFAVRARLELTGRPRSIAVDPDGRWLAVTLSRPDELLLVEVKSFTPLAQIRLGRTPAGVALDEAGAFAYVANSESDDVSVVDLAAQRETARLPAGRRPWAVALHAPSHRILVTSLLADVTPTDATPFCEVTVVGTATQQVEARLRMASCHLATSIAAAADRPFALIACTRVRNLLPITQVARSWVTDAALGVLFLDETPRVVVVPLDSFDRCHADVTSVAFAADGATAWVAAGGGDELLTLDVAALARLAAAAPRGADGTPLEDSLDASPQFVTATTATKAQPVALTAARAGHDLFFAERLDDSIVRCDGTTGAVASRLVLPHPVPERITHQGERVFCSAALTFERQFSCQSCHPDAATDGLVYDFESDGLGRNVVKNRDLRGLVGTQPFKWNGKNPSLQEQCGRRFASVLTRTEPFAAADLEALVHFLESLPATNRRPEEAQRTACEERGKALFERTRKNDGGEIPVANRCTTCHPAPFFTNRFTSDVGTRSRFDTTGSFDPPHLLGVRAGAPYLHDGRARTLEELWTVFNADGRHGFSADWSKQQLNDLIAYLDTL